MSHLPTERLAALGGRGGGPAGGANQAPTSEELAHLAACPDCAHERLAFQRLANLASAESARLGAPLGAWESLRPALLAEGMILAPTRGSGLTATTVGRGRPRWLQAAAAVVLVSTGVMMGRYSAGARAIPVPGSLRSTLAAQNASAQNASAQNASAQNASAQNVGNATAATPTTDSVPRFASIEEARAAQERSQLVYQTATAFIAERDTTNATQSVASMRARLAALDRARQVMGEALNKAPYDPVLNGYYLTTVGQREATLRQINTVMPASMRISSY